MFYCRFCFNSSVTFEPSTKWTIFSHKTLILVFHTQNASIHSVSNRWRESFKIYIFAFSVWSQNFTLHTNSLKEHNLLPITLCVIFLSLPVSNYILTLDDIFIPCSLFYHYVIFLLQYVKHRFISWFLSCFWENTLSVFSFTLVLFGNHLYAQFPLHYVLIWRSFLHSSDICWGITSFFCSSFARILVVTSVSFSAVPVQDAGI